MRIRKGSRVEAWCREVGPMGAWCSGDVVWGNGHSYIVRYHHVPPGMACLSERIPRKYVRPYPPVEPAARDWGVGDIVEVLDEHSWKCGKIMRKCGEVTGANGGRFDVKIVGLSKVVRVLPSMIRVQRMLDDRGEWVVIHKEKRRSSLHGRDDGGCAREYGELGASALKSAKKKRCHGLMDSEFVQGVGGKRIRVEEEQKYETSLAGRLSDLTEKIDGFAYAVGLLDTGLDKLKKMSDFDCDVAGTEGGGGGGEEARGGGGEEEEEDDDDDTNTVSSSVGSSSSYSISSSGAPQDLNASRLQNSGIHSDNRIEPYPKVRGSRVRTEPFLRVKEAPIDGKEISNKQIHHLELKAYNSTIEAFYASGPLSWKQEELLTNLRLMLHISNDEHLQVIKELISCSARELL